MKFDPVFILDSIQHNIFYIAALMFIAIYPIFGAIMWITTSLFYWFRRERHAPQGVPLQDFFPMVSILIPAHNEERTIKDVIKTACSIDYPHYEVIVINDGSKDHTEKVVKEVAQHNSKVRLISKKNNEGKAMALNDSLMCAKGDFVLIIDADAEPTPTILQYLIPHFKSARVAAVTGNPRVKNTPNFLTRLQLIEYTSIISILRRSQRIWGRIMTMSGVVFAARKNAIFSVGLFSPYMETEDIDLTWKFQTHFWDVRYESNALVWMEVPSTYRNFFHQRRRWARGLMQVLHRNFSVAFKWKQRRIWPIFYESLLSSLWSTCFVSMAIIWTISLLLDYPPIGANPIPNAWGMAIATLSLSMHALGAALDKRYDPDIIRFYPYAVYYPIIYWLILAIIASMELPVIFKNPLKKKKLAVWLTRRNT